MNKKTKSALNDSTSLTKPKNLP